MFDMVRDCLKIEKSLRQMAGMLLLNGSLTNCPGLIHGKMGIAIFFFHYAQHTGNALFDNYAVNLIELIQEQIHANSLADYERGIAGIGVGLNYLISNNFLEAEDNIFEDFDERMYRAVMYDPWLDFSLYDGLTGYGRYWIRRLNHSSSNSKARECLLRIVKHVEVQLSLIPENEQSDVYCFLQDLCQFSEFTELSAKNYKWDLNCSRLGNSIVGNVARMYYTQPDEIDAVFNQMPDFEKTLSSMGLLTGYVGEGMLRLSTLKSNMLWMHLL